MAFCRDNSPTKSNLIENGSRSLLIICKLSLEYHVYELAIKESGIIEGCSDDFLPVFYVLGKEEESQLKCTNLGSSIYKLGRFAGEQRDDCIAQTLETRALDVGTWSDVLKGCMVVGAFRKIFVLDEQTSSCDPFKSFDPETGVWKLLLPPPFYSTSSVTVTGYAVLDKHNFILFCCQVPCSSSRTIYQFYTFNVLTNDWKIVTACEPKQCPVVEYNPYHPFFGVRPECGVNYPLFGKAEVVDDIIYGYLLRTVVKYQFKVEGDDTVSLSLPTLCYKATFSDTLAGPITKEFGDATVFQAPFGWPRLNSRSITHMGEGMFCVVETLEELPYEADFQVAYINTFRLGGETLEVLDSTKRCIDLTSSYGSCEAEIMLCFKPFNHRIAWNQAPDPCPSPYLNEHYMEMIPRFCNRFFQDESEMVPLTRHAKMLFWKWRHELQRWKDPVVVYFHAYMEWLLEDGDEPTPVLLLDKKFEKLAMETKVLDMDRRPVFLFFNTSNRCAIFKLEVEDGGIVSDQISPERIVESGGNIFITKSFEVINDHIYLFFGSHDRMKYTVTTCHAIDLRSTLPDRHISDIKEGPSSRFIIVSKGLKIFVLSDALCPSESGFVCKPVFKCFDPEHNVCNELELPPYQLHGRCFPQGYFPQGYAIVGNHILFSIVVNKECNLYSYNVRNKKWMDVNLEGSGSCIGIEILGRAEYVDGVIYSFRGGFVHGLPVQEEQDSLRVQPKRKLEGLDVACLPFPWFEQVKYGLAYLGNKVFCGVETGCCCVSVSYQYVRVTLFSVNGLHVNTLHSKICVLNMNGIAGADLSLCCSLMPKSLKRKASQEVMTISMLERSSEESDHEGDARMKKI